MTLTTLRQVKVLLGREWAQTRVLFVTTDPARDTPERLRWYVSLFDREFIGLTGPPPSLTRIYRAFNVVPTPYAPEGTGQDTRIGHATAIYLIDRRGMIRFSYPWGIPAPDLAADVRVLLKEP